MRTIKVNLYQFDELSEDAKQKALEQFYDINVDYDWWEFTYDYIAEVFQAFGFDHGNIKGFDLDRASYIDIDTRGYAEDVLKAVQSFSPEDLERWKACKIDLPELPVLNKWYTKLLGSAYTPTIDVSGKYANIKFDSDLYGYDNLESEAEKLESFCTDIAEELYNFAFYALRNEYEYKTSEEAIIESIKANEYEFEKDGSFH